MKKNIVLLIFSLFFSLFLIEIILIFKGTYVSLTKNKLVPSAALYERPSSSFQKVKHPDLNYLTSNYFDENGVKNYSNIPTHKKKNIIGFFGDSFTENINIKKDFEFSNILNKVTSDHEVVNYGVGGYALDQSFIRYLKYQKNNFKHIFYLFMPGDQVSSSNLIEFKDNTFIIKEPSIGSFFKILGKLNISYLIFDVYYLVRSKLFSHYTLIDKSNYSGFFANKIYRGLYNYNKHSELSKWYKELYRDSKHINQFYFLLKFFNDEVKKNNSNFYVLVYPEKEHVLYFKKAIKNRENEINYFILDKKFQTNIKTKKGDGSYKYLKTNLEFKNDNHWNEYGNLEFTKYLLNIFNELNITFEHIDFKKKEKDISAFYDKFKN